MEGSSTESSKEIGPIPSLVANIEETNTKARVDAMWELMNKGVPNKAVNDLLKKNISSVNKTKTSKKSTANWMTYLGMTPKSNESPVEYVPQKEHCVAQNSSSDEAKRVAAAAALAAVKDAVASSSGRGKFEIKEVRDFAGQEIEVKKYVDADSKEALEKAKAPPASGVDAVLEQIKKKQKLSVLDKTKKDWGEFKEDKKLEEELDAYKKSSNQYLDKVSFLQRADYREYERERDARLAVQAKRRPDMREEP